MIQYRKKRHCFLFYFIIFGFLPGLSFAQKALLEEVLVKHNIPTKDGSIMYEVVDSSFPGKSKEQIFNAAQSTLVQIFKDSKDVLEVVDKEDGHLMGKGSAKFHFTFVISTVNIVLPFVVDIKIKDGKYRVQLRDFYSFTDSRIVNGDRFVDEVTFSKLATKAKSYQRDFFEQMNPMMIRTLQSIQDGTNKKLAGKDDF